MMRRIAPVRIAAPVLLVAAAACGAAAATGGPPLVDLDEFTVEASGTFVPGQNVLEITNSGRFGHTVVIADESGHVIRASDLIAPGEGETFAVDLEAGRYQISCRIVVATDGGLVDHYEEGMVTRVDVPP